MLRFYMTVPPSSYMNCFFFIFAHIIHTFIFDHIIHTHSQSINFNICNVLIRRFKGPSGAPGMPGIPGMKGHRVRNNLSTNETH